MHSSSALGFDSFRSVGLASPFIHCYRYLVAVNWDVRDAFRAAFSLASCSFKLSEGLSTLAHNRPKSAARDHSGSLRILLYTVKIFDVI